MKDIVNIDSDGKRHGNFIKYYDNDQINVEATYDHGECHGEYNSYFYNGQLCTKTTCVRDEYHGAYINYYPDGQINVEATYDHGVVKSSKRPLYKKGRIVMDKIEVDCDECGFTGEIEINETRGGMFFEDQNRVHVTGDCPECGNNLINYHATREEKV